MRGVYLNSDDGRREWSECCLQVDTPNAEAARLGCTGLRAPLVGAEL